MDRSVDFRVGYRRGRFFFVERKKDSIYERDRRRNIDNVRRLRLFNYRDRGGYEVDRDRSKRLRRFSLFFFDGGGVLFRRYRLRLLERGYRLSRRFVLL